MNLWYREQRQLRGIEAGLFRSDSHLAAMLKVFGRLYDGQDMPASEQVGPGHGRDRRAVARIAAAFAAAAFALSVLFSAALAWPPRCGLPASGHRPPSLSAYQTVEATASRALPDRNPSCPAAVPGR